MKPKFRSLVAAFAPLSRSSLIVIASLCAATSANAASATWNATAVDGNWATASGNWTSAVPGSTAPSSNNTSNSDTATFNAVSNFPTISIDNTRFVKNIAFNTGAGAYHFTDGLLYVWQAGSITMNAGVTNAQQFSNTWQVRQASSNNGAYSLVNNSSTSAATMTFDAATFTLTNANGRPTTLTLDGSNTGNNMISSAITDANSTNQGVNAIIKNGTGTWILSGSNSFTATTATSFGFQINSGVLVAENNTALGSNAVTNNYINSGGTLELNSSGPNGSITLNNALTLTLWGGGTLRSNGTNTLASTLKLDNTGGSTAISTVNSSDVFTIGDGTNDFSGGNASTVLHITGPGTVLLGQASNYAGTVSVDAGTLQLGNATGLGPAASAGVTFGAGSTGVLQLNGFSPTLASLTTNPTVGTPVVENNNAANATLTLNAASGTSTFGGVLRDGAAGGTLTLVKAGGSTRTLTGASTYTGGTTISNGTLLADNTSGSATGTGAVAVNGGALGGTGTVTGAVTVASGAAIAPGDGGIGTLSTGSLTLASGSQLNYDITDASNLDKITVTGGGTLTINGGQLNINGGTSAFTTNGVYNLIGGYTGSILGTGVSALSVNTLNKDLLNKTYTIGENGGYVTLTIANSGAVVDYWNADADGNWNTGPWTPAVPNAIGAFASFGGGGTAITAPRTVTVLTSKTVGTLSFNNATQAFTLAAGGGTVTLDNGATGSFVTDTAGSHLIQAPLTTTANGATFSVVTLGDSLTTTGVISGTGPVTKVGNGTLVLNGVNSYTAATQINAGTVSINSATSLGDAGYTTTIGAATLEATADITTTRNFDLTDVASTILVDATKTYSISGVIGAGAGTLNKAGAGTLALTGTNTYTGGTVVTQGSLTMNGDAALGAAPGSPATNLTLNPGTGNSVTLQLTGGFTLNTNRSISLASGTAVIDTNGNNLAFAGNFSGSGLLHKISAGDLTLTGVNNVTATGGITIDAGLVRVNDRSNLPGGTITLNGTGGIFNGNNTSYYDLVVNGTNSLTKTYAGNILGLGVITGNGTLTFGGPYVNDFTGSWSAFTGTIIANAGGFRFNGTGGGTNVTLDLANYTASVRNSATTITLGALAGTSSSVLTGSANGAVQAVTYAIGGKTVDGLGITPVDSTFNGTITNGANTTGINKVGNSVLTLTGTNTYTGATTISAGTLQIGAGGTTGSISNTSGVNDNAALVYDRSDSLTVAYNIYGSGSVSLIGSGTTTFTFGGNGYTGGMTISNGSTVNIDSTWELGGAGYGGITFGLGGGTLQYATTLLNTATDLTQDTSDGGLGITGNPKDVTLTGTATIDTNGHDVLFLNSVGNNGAGGLTKIGAGTLTLSGANNYTGATTVNAGTLALVGGSQTSAITVNNSGTSLGFTLGSTTSTTSTVSFGAGTTVKITGTPTLASYTLMTASSFTGITPVLDTPIPGYALSVTGGNTLVLSQAAGYTSWASSKGLTTGVNDGALQDPNNNGISNVLEYVLNGEPLLGESPASILPALNASGSNFVFTFTRRVESADDTTQTFQYGTNLASWTSLNISPGTPDAGVVIGTPTGGTPNTQTVTVTVAKGANTKMFGRLQAVK